MVCRGVVWTWGQRGVTVLSGVLLPDETVGHLIRLAQQRHTLLWMREMGADLDVTGPQYALLSAISASEGIDQRSAGESASLDKSSTADIVARLEGQGWIRVGRDPADGRRKTLFLMPLARAALCEVTRRAAVVQERLLDLVPSAWRKDFVDVLRRVAYTGAVPMSERVSAALDLRDMPGHLIRRAQQVHTVAWGAEVGRVLTAPQYAVLSVLWTHPEGVDQSTAGELASLDKSSMADVAKRLVRRGWIARERDAKDARRRLLHVTDSVREELVRLTPAVVRVQKQLLEPLADAGQRELFIEGCRVLAHAAGGGRPAGAQAPALSQVGGNGPQGPSSSR